MYIYYLIIYQVDKIKNSGEIKDDKAKYKKIDRDVRKLRINKLKEKYTYTDSKLLVHMLTVVHTNYENSMKNDDDSSYEAFVYEVKYNVVLYMYIVCTPRGMRL